MKLKELEKFVNELAKQMQELTERVNHLEILRARVGVEATPEEIEKLKQANNDLLTEAKANMNPKPNYKVHRGFCGSQ